MLVRELNRRSFLQGARRWEPGGVHDARAVCAAARGDRYHDGRAVLHPDALPLDTDNDLLIINDSITPAVGEITHLTGRVLTRSGQPVRNAFVEIWQVDHTGLYVHTGGRQPSGFDRNFQGYGRFLSDAKGHVNFRTIKPNPVHADRHLSNRAHPCGCEPERPARVHIAAVGQRASRQRARQRRAEPRAAGPRDPARRLQSIARYEVRRAVGELRRSRSAPPRTSSRWDHCAVWRRRRIVGDPVAAESRPAAPRTRRRFELRGLGSEAGACQPKLSEC